MNKVLRPKQPDETPYCIPAWRSLPGKGREYPPETLPDCFESLSGTDPTIPMSFDCTKAGLTDTLSGKITLDTECNPLHGPRVLKIIEALKSGSTADKKAYVDEEMFSADPTVTKVSVSSQDFNVTKLTQEVLSKRAY